MLSLLLAVSVSAPSIEFDWNDTPDRIWLGEDWWANAIQDWRVEDGRVVCTEGRPNMAVRTAQLLTTYLSDEPGSFSLSVTLGSNGKGVLREGSLAGIHLGHGGSTVDHRITCLVHHKPAEDGGMLAVIDHEGRVQLRDFSQPRGGGNGWSLGGPTEPSAMPEYEAVESNSSASSMSNEVRLGVFATPSGSGYTIYLNAVDAINGEVLSAAIYENVPAHQVSGGIGLVSHLGPDQEKTFWFDDVRIDGSKVRTDDSRAFGPVIASQYTLSGGKVKMTVQMPPLGEGDRQVARIEADAGNGWEIVDVAALDKDAYTFRFRFDYWYTGFDVRYRIVYDGAVAWTGYIATEPTGKDEITVAAFTGHKTYVGPLKWNENGIWTPHQEVVDGVKHFDPDFMFFSGDQIYEGDLTPARRNPPEEAYLDYLHKYYRFLWAYRDLMKDRPSVSIPDDHDVYHGNVWGAGGRRAYAHDGMTAQDSGGYTMPAAFVNAVHKSQTSHLPDAFDPTPIEQGISTYYTNIEYGGISFAVIGDRMFKDSPTPTVPAGDFKNGWPQADGFDAKDADVPGAILLGERQERFLDQWVDDWSGGTWMKVLLSQTPFANVATLPAGSKSGSIIPSLPVYARGDYPPDDMPVSDGDSNSWPQTPRNRAVRTLRRGFAFHINGDSHLSNVVQYGVDEFGDAGYSFCVPAVGNTWPRRWLPLERGQNQKPGAPRYTGDYHDGFGNKMTVHAVANPFDTKREPKNLYNRVPGFGIVVFNKLTREITMNCWPRWVRFPAQNDQQYKDWPIKIDQQDNYARERWGYLPPLISASNEDPVVQVVDESNGEVLYTIRAQGRSFKPWVFKDGSYTVWFGEPETSSWTAVKGLRPSSPSPLP